MVTFARISSSAASSLPISRFTSSRPTASRSKVCRSVARSSAICCTCAGSREGAAGALGVRFSGAVCATVAACGLSNADGRTAVLSGPASC